MNTGSKTVQIFESALLLLGLLLVAVFALAHVHRFIMVRAEMARFEAKKVAATRGDARTRPVDSTEHDTDDPEAWSTEQSLWSPQRIRSYEATLSEPAEALAILRIPKLHLEVPVLDGTSQFTLKNCRHCIPGTGR